MLLDETQNTVPTPAQLPPEGSTSAVPAQVGIEGVSGSNAATVAKNPKGAGRKTKRSPEREDKIILALRNGNTRKASAEFAGVSERTLYDWIAQFPQFSQAVERAESECEVEMAAIIRTTATGYETTETRITTKEDGSTVTVIETKRVRDWRAAESWLKRRRRAEWGDNVALDLDSEITDLLALLAGAGEEEAAGSA